MSANICAAKDKCSLSHTPLPTTNLTYENRCCVCQGTVHLNGCCYKFNELELYKVYIGYGQLSPEGQQNISKEGLVVCLHCVESCGNDITKVTVAEIHQKLDNMTNEVITAILPTTNNATWLTHYHLTTMRASRVLSRIRRLVNDVHTLTIRGMYYEHELLFQSAKVCGIFLRELACRMNLSINNIGIRPDSSRGKIAASPNFRLRLKRGNETEVVDFAPKVISTMLMHSIPSAFLEALDQTADHNGNVVEITHIGLNGDGTTFEPQHIIVIEKKHWPEQLIKDGICTERKIIMVCSEGNQAHSVLACVKFLHTTFPNVNITAGGDPGPVGCEIVARYHYAESYGFKFSVAWDKLKWGFLLPRDVYEDEHTKDSLHLSRSGITDRDRQAYQRLQQHPWFLYGNGQAKLAELGRMMTEVEKHEMNGYKPSGGRTLKEFVLTGFANAL